MQQSSIEEFLKLDVIDYPEERYDIHVQFPHVVLVEGAFPEFDVAHRWCWSHFGPQHGECWRREYPSCPLTLATERIELRHSVNGPRECKVYDFVPDHCHMGNWTIFWFSKTDYDYGFGEFCFAEQIQKDAFVKQIPNIDWGENWNK